jgi:hypothetical protein
MKKTSRKKIGTENKNKSFSFFAYIIEQYRKVSENKREKGQKRKVMFDFVFA